MRTTTPFTITSRIAEALGLPDSHMADALLITRYKAVAEIVSSFLNYTNKDVASQQGFFASMIIRILRPDDRAVHFSDIQTVIRIIEKGDEAIQQEMKQEREDWRSLSANHQTITLTLYKWNGSSRNACSCKRL